MNKKGKYERTKERLWRLLHDACLKHEDVTVTYSNEELAGLMGRSVVQIKRYLADLKREGRVFVEHKITRFGVNGAWVNRRNLSTEHPISINNYKILTPQERAKCNTTK